MSDDPHAARLAALLDGPAPPRVAEDDAGLAAALSELFESQLLSRELDHAARALRRRDVGYYTIGSAGHEGNAVLGGGRAIRYKVAVGKRGKVWTGQTFIDGKYVKPAWSPSAEVHRDHPSLPDVIAGGAPNNPMGVAALTLNGGKYAIHGTNRPGSIGRAVSYGCIRMANSDITDLFRRVGLRTPVIAVP